MAVLSVLAFHVGISLTPGGFLGVDVFFVISGYLIGALLFKDLAADRFSVGGFYERRIRRLAPALFVMLAATTTLAAIVMFPPAFAEYGRSLLAASVSLSNIYFDQTAGYFTDGAATIPLLHTWSLSVEEQFYLAFPLVLAAIFRMRRTAAPVVLAALGAASFGVSVAMAADDPQSPFYLPYTRAWQLMLGAMLATGKVALPQPVWVRSLAGVAGLGLIVTSMLRGAGGAAGFETLPACIGTALVIAAGQGSDGGLAARLLSLRPVVLVGLMSYSIYLWHWPVIVILRSWTGRREFSRLEEIVIVALSLGLGYLSWRFVERPTRNAPVSRRTVFLAGAAATILTASIAALIVATEGAPQRFPRETAALASHAAYDPRADFREHECFITPTDSFRQFRPGRCTAMAADRQNVLLLGDSHAAHFWKPLSAVAPSLNVMQANVAGCTLDVEAPAHEAPRCRQMMDYVFRTFLPHRRIDRLILSADWRMADLPRVERVLIWAGARNVPVVILGPSVTYESSLPGLLARAKQVGAPDLPAKRVVGGTAEVDRALAALARRDNAEYVSIYSEMCPDGVCRTTFDGEPVYFDDDHFTQEAAESLLRSLIRKGELRLQSRASTDGLNAPGAATP